LTDHEYNHIARVMVQSAEVETAELHRSRAAAERWDDGFASRTDGPIENFNSFLAFLFCAPTRVDAGHSTRGAPATSTPSIPEPELVFLDGTAASALERSKEQLSEAEYTQILQTQLQLAELTEQAERDRANRLRPKRVPLYENTQPRLSVVPSPRLAPPPAPQSTTVPAAQPDTRLVESVEPMDRIDSTPVRGGAPSLLTPTNGDGGPKPYANLFGFEATPPPEPRPV
jgi:hypothetical protein